MRTMLKVLMSALVLTLGMVSLSATAATGSVSAEGFYKATTSQEAVGGQFQSVALNRSDIEHLSLAQAASIIGGAIVGGSVVDVVLDGTVFTIIGVIVGATLGNEWYERGMWPF
ncbi:conserved exported hypothetical protein [Gammaproteobacteria bacterium]